MTRVESGGVVAKRDKKYPVLLGGIKDAPEQLYYRGSWNSDIFKNCLAVVGTRRMTSYGRRVTDQIVGEVASRGITIVSGFMYGIDAQAHRAAIEAGGKTIAVMPCGIDLVHPAHQTDLHEDITDSGGLIVSEYQSTHPAAIWTFSRRNRIVAGLSQTILVVEAGEGSGALITANFAKKYGRKIMVIPNSIVSPVSRGVTQLLREGAAPVECAGDVLQHYGIIGFKREQKKPPIEEILEEVEGEVEKNIVRQLEKEAMEVDELARVLGINASDLGSALSLLQLGGYIREEQGMFYLCS
ncbi:MAG: DNA-processing protein DprA [bacterium]|nr:DNA-processing protein DprA [bacterium]